MYRDSLIVIGKSEHLFLSALHIHWYYWFNCDILKKITNFFEITANFRLKEIFWIVLFLLLKYLQWKWLLFIYPMLPVFRSSHPEVFFRKGVLKICSKFTGEHPCRSAISIKLLWNCTSAWVFSCKFASYFQNTFSKEHLWVTASKYYCSLIVYRDIYYLLLDENKVLSTSCQSERTFY